MAGFMDALLKRRSNYHIDDTIPCTDEELHALLASIIQNAPTAFNMQSTRAVLLLGESHKKLWQIVLDTLQPRVPESAFAKTERKVNGCFACGHGTILYYGNPAIVEQYAANNPTYKDLFPEWALQQNGMLQFAVWTALAEKGIGASLQHYNPLIDEAVAEAFNLPKEWRLLAQMPFGNITAPPDGKEFAPIDTRLFLRT